MSEPKTKPTSTSVLQFIDTNTEGLKRQDSLKLLDMFTHLTGENAKMWGASIIGFGMYHYKSNRSSQEGDWPLVGFSPRKQNLTLYISFEFDGVEELLARLGKHKTSKACLYVNKLADIDESVLAEIIKQSFIYAKKTLT